MPKLKTKKSVKKRMKLTKNGKIKRFKAGDDFYLRLRPFQDSCFSC